MMKKVAVSTLIAKYKNIHLLDDFEIREEHPVLYRYMAYSKFKDIINHKKLTFVHPKLWEDPFETRFVESDFKKLNTNFQRPDVFCLCVTNQNTKDSAAAWDLYSKKERTVRVSLSFYQLMNELEKFADKQTRNCKIYIGPAIYNLSQTEIKKLHKSSEREFYFPSTFGIEDYLRLLRLKRPNFSFENEIRLFVVFEGCADEQDVLFLENIDVESLIFQVLLEPDREILTKKDIQKDLERLNLNKIKIKQSNLYKGIGKLTRF